MHLRLCRAPLASLLPLAICAATIHAQTTNAAPRDVPAYAASKHLLPQFILEGDDVPAELPALIDHAWQLAFANIERPAQHTDGSFALPCTFIDAAFSDNIFQWDTCFIMQFARHMHAAFPAIESLDNFYAQQRDDGFICREYRKLDAAPVMFPSERDSVNPPLFAWAEVQAALASADLSRCKRVLHVLDRYARWLEVHRSVQISQGSISHTLYWNTPFGSGMDNTPEQGAAWISMSAQMAQMYESLAAIAQWAGRLDRVQVYKEHRSRIIASINACMWNQTLGSYTNIALDGTPVATDTISIFWPLWAGCVPEHRIERVVALALDTTRFNTPVPFATLSRTHPSFDAAGGYWLGASWAPTTSMVIDGLARAGKHEAAAQTAMRFITAMCRVHAATGTIWENYAPLLVDDKPTQGTPAKPDFVGWSGLGPLSMTLDHLVGITINAPQATVQWRLTRTGRTGVRNLRIGASTLALIAQERPASDAPVTISWEVQGPPLDVQLRVQGKPYEFRIAGSGEWKQP